MRFENLLNFSSKPRLPIYMQSEVAECGLACLAMVANFHGHDIDLMTLRRRYPISLRGMDLPLMMQICNQLHLSPRPLRLELEELPQLKAPCILHWNLDHFVVLKSANESKIVIHDPAMGIREFTYEECSKHFTGVALELTPTSEFKPKTERRDLKFSAFWGQIRGLKPYLGQLFALSIVLQIISIASPFYMQLVVDEVLLSYDKDLLVVLAVGFLLIGFIQIGTSWFRTLLVMHLSTRLNMQLGANIFHHLIRLSMSYFTKRHIGDVVSRFNSYRQIEQLLSTQLVSAVLDGFMAITTSIMLFIYAPALALIVIGAVALYTILRFAWYYPLRIKTEEAIMAGAKESSYFMETLRGIQSIKIFGAEHKREMLWQNRYADTLNAGVRVNRLKMHYSLINGFLTTCENVLVIYLAASMVMNNAMSAGMLFAFMSYKSQFTQRTSDLVENLISMKMLGLHLDRLADIVLEPKEGHFEHQDIESLGQSQSHELVGKIQFEKLSYQYEGQQNFVFNDLSFTIEPGESVAIIGPSGCGKTTLMKVLMGMFASSSGEIKIDDKPLNVNNMSNYRAQIAAVMQDDQLLAGTLSENIAFFEPNANMERIVQCAQMAGLSNTIAAMPMGFNTLIGDMGTSLSGGEKQRILLARALYREPKILFLDEATSHLDVGMEHVVNTAIVQLKMTRVIIAHRPETIKSADKVVVLTPAGLVCVNDLQNNAINDKPVLHTSKMKGQEVNQSQTQADLDTEELQKVV